MKLRAVWLICAAGMLALAGCTGDARGAATPTPDGPTPTITPALLLPVALTPIGPATTAGARPASSAATARPGTVVPTPFPAFQPSSAVSATVPILMYHQIRDLPANASADDLTWTVSPASLAAQLAYLSDRGYTTITLDQLLDGFSGQAPLPPKPVVITFDDGWKTQYTNALPLLKKYGQTATFYIVSSYMGYGAYFDWTMTTEVLKAGMTIGGHTVDHKSLTGLSATDLDHELRDSKALLDSKLGISVTHLAYPNGAFNDTVVAAARRAGYRSATTINPAPVKSPLVPLSLPRLRVSYKDTLADFIKKLP